MSRNVFINSTIWNCSAEDFDNLIEHLRKKFPNKYGSDKSFTLDELIDLVVLKDFDAKITEAIIKFRRSLEK